ncbi:MAG: hypothetical protein Fur003_2110 [Candidatus Dojkabacteria bacterium]
METDLIKQSSNLQAFFINIVNTFTNSLMFYALFQILNITPSLAELVLYSALSDISLLLSLTPGSLGIREAIFLFSSTLLGASSQQILNVSVIDRGITLILLFALFIYTLFPKNKIYSSYKQ